MTERVMTDANGRKYITTEPFKPDWNTEAVLVEEMQRMAKRIEELEALALPDTDMAYTIALQRAIEWHCEDKVLQQALEALDGGHIDRAYGYIEEALAQPTQPSQRDLTGPERNVLHKALRRTGKLIETSQTAPQRQPLTESMIKAGLAELEAIRQTELVGDYELIKRLLEAAHGIGDKT